MSVESDSRAEPVQGGALVLGARFEQAALVAGSGYRRDIVTAADIVAQWVSAYVDGRGDDLVALAHEDIVVRPRRGQGEPEYRGLDGVRDYVNAIGDPPPPFKLDTVETLDDGRVIACGSIDGVSVVAVFEICDQNVIAVTSYVTDRELLHEIGRI